MKKILALTLAILFAVTLCNPAVLAETASEPTTPAAPLVDLTQLIVAIVLVIFNFLLAWIIKAVIPPIKKWLDTHTTAEQQALIWDVITRLVEAAEQVLGAGEGAKKMTYVQTALKSYGFNVDVNLIEAAVKEMNDKALLKISEAVEFETPGNEDTLDPVA